MRIWNAGQVRSVDFLVKIMVEGLVLRSLQGARVYDESGGSSIHGEDSKGRRVFVGSSALSKCNRNKNDFDYELDAITTAVIRGLPSQSRKLPKLLGGQVNDIRLFLDSLARLDDLRYCYIRHLIPVFMLQRLC
ncbi:unnamed protein product, partial [Laminaria digitata]